MKNENGQVMVFGAISIFLLVATISMVIEVGKVTSTKVKLQNAADSSALAGAQILANTFSRVAWINDHMALIYFHLMRYSVDVSVSATLLQLSERGPPFPSDSVVGVSNIKSKYDEAYDRAAWISTGQDWLNQLSYMQRGMALIVPVMVQREIYDIAVENGAAQAALFPKFQLFPHPDSYIKIDIQKLQNGWSLTSTKNEFMEVTSKGDESWHIKTVKANNTLEVDVDKLGEDHFFVKYIDNNKTIEVEFEKTSETEYEITYVEGDIKEVVHIDTEGDLFVKGGDVTTKQNKDGSKTVCNKGDCVDIKWGPNGLLVDEGNGWEPLNKEDSVDVNGAEIKVDNFDFIDMGSATVWQNHMRIGNTYVYFTDPVLVKTDAGNISVTYTDPIKVSAYMAPAWIGIKDDFATANGLSTKNPQCIWYKYNADLVRHRLCQEELDLWAYEYKRHSSYLLPDNMDRFALRHGVSDNAQGEPQDWLTWFNHRTGMGNTETPYHQTRKCWHPYDISGDPLGPPPTGQQPDGQWEDQNNNVISCPVCWDWDVKGAPMGYARIYQYETYGRKGGSGLDADDRQTVDLSSFARPLVLSNDFFKFGITVGVWAKPEDPSGVFSNYFSHPSSGMFAVASARAGFYDVVEGEYVFQFTDIDEREEWVNESFANLYEPTWTAKLFPVRDMILTEDLDAEESVDSGYNYLMRSLFATEWYKDYFSSQSYTGAKANGLNAPWNGGKVNFSSLKIEEVLQH